MTHADILASPEWRTFQERCVEIGKEAYLTGNLQPLAVHPRGTCISEACIIHNPSDHHMKDWPTNWRYDRGIMERICPHGIGHPDPDDMAFLERMGRNRRIEEIHGCDGCCNPPTLYTEEYLG